VILDGDDEEVEEWTDANEDSIRQYEAAKASHAESKSLRETDSGSDGDQNF
jgi:hypothetical protein